MKNIQGELIWKIKRGCPGVYFADKSNFEAIKKKFIKWWSAKIHILADFDGTLTKTCIDWEKKAWILNAIKDNNLLWEEFKSKWKDLFNKYYPIEIDPKIKMEDKIMHMTIWWEKTFEMMIKYGLTIKDLNYAWSCNYTYLRDWFDYFYALLEKNNIPFVVMSAWIKELIEAFFIYNLDKLENIDIIANEMIWNNDWKIEWYKKPIIHVFNKAESLISSHKNIFNKIKNKKNVILLWDSLWDHHMIEWFEYDNLIKIWFLNNDIDWLYEEFIDRYDVVIKWDGDMSFINDLLKECF